MPIHRDPEAAAIAAALREQRRTPTLDEMFALRLDRGEALMVGLIDAVEKLGRREDEIARLCHSIEGRLDAIEARMAAMGAGQGLETIGAWIEPSTAGLVHVDLGGGTCLDAAAGHGGPLVVPHPEPEVKP